ncbi:MAG: hypothetical protein ACLU37_09440 [Collinsella sp.]
MGAVSGMAQVNVRVDRQVKNRAEEALRLSGGRCPSSSKRWWPRSRRVAGSARKCLRPSTTGSSRRARYSVRRVVGVADRLYAIWASLRRLYPTIAIGTQSIPKPWTSAIAKGMIL